MMRDDLTRQVQRELLQIELEEKEMQKSTPPQVQVQEPAAHSASKSLPEKTLS